MYFNLNVTAINLKENLVYNYSPIWNNIWYSFETNLIENGLLILKKRVGDVYRKDGQSAASENVLKTKLAESCDLTIIGFTSNPALVWLVICLSLFEMHFVVLFEH